jgi:phosphoinositide 3-/4-kinase-like protein
MNVSVKRSCEPAIRNVPVRRLIAAIALAAAAASASARAGEALSAKTWLGHAAEIERHLLSADIVRMEAIGTGVTKPQRAHLAPAAPFESLVWKPLAPGMRGGYQESYKSEIAAYELDKLLALNMVPPAVERRIDGDAGAAIMWLEGTRSVKETGGKVPTGPQFGRPLRVMQMFDNLIGNADRNAGNILIDGANNVILIDHSRAFIASDTLPWKFERVDGELWPKFKALTAQELKTTLGQWVDDEAIRGMIARRDRMAREVDKLTAKKGAAATIIQ